MPVLVLIIMLAAGGCAADSPGPSTVAYTHMNVNPLDDINHARSIDGVMVSGRWFTADELNERRRESAR